MSLASEAQHPSVSTVFLLELTASLLLRGFVAHSIPTYKVTVPVGVTVVSSVQYDGAAMTERASIALVMANSNSWYFNGTTIYLHPPAGRSIISHAYTATCNFYFSNKPKTFNAQWYDPRLTSVPTLSLRIESKFTGVGQVGTGQCALANHDQFFDALNELNWNAGRAVFLMGIDRNTEADYADYEPIGTWRSEITERTDESFFLSLVEIKTNLERKIPLETFELADYPNIAKEWVGKPIPRAYGKIFGVNPVLIDATTNRFKLCGHAITSFDEIRMRTDADWVVIPFATTDKELAEFTLGPSWEAGNDLSVDFSGMPGDDGRLMTNAADIVTDLLEYVGETSFDSASFTESRRQLRIGTDTFGGEVNHLKLALYLHDTVEAREVASRINAMVGSFLFVDFDGVWHYEVFSPKPVTALTVFGDIDFINDSTKRQTSTVDVFSRVDVSFNPREQEKWTESYQLPNSKLQYRNGLLTHTPKAVKADLWDNNDVRYYAQRLLTTEALPLVKFTAVIPWQAFVVLPGQHVRLTRTRGAIDGVFEVLEVKHDIAAAKATLLLGDRRAWLDSFGWWAASTEEPWGGWIIPPAPSYTESIVLAAGVAQLYTLPNIVGTTGYVEFSADGNFYAKRNGAAAAPSTLTTGAGVFCNPAAWQLSGLTSIGLYAPANTVVTLGFFSFPTDNRITQNQTSGYWLGDNELAANDDQSSHLTSRWW